MILETPYRLYSNWKIVCLLLCGWLHCYWIFYDLHWQLFQTVMFKYSICSVVPASCFLVIFRLYGPCKPCDLLFAHLVWHSKLHSTSVVFTDESNIKCILVCDGMIGLWNKVTLISPKRLQLDFWFCLISVFNSLGLLLSSDKNSLSWQLFIYRLYMHSYLSMASLRKLCTVIWNLFFQGLSVG